MKPGKGAGASGYREVGLTVRGNGGMVAPRKLGNAGRRIDMRPHGRFVGTVVVALLVSCSPTPASAGPFGVDLWLVSEPDYGRPPKPGEHLGEYLLAERMPVRVLVPGPPPLPQTVTPLPPYEAPPERPVFRIGSYSRDWELPPPQPKLGDLPPEPGACPGEYAAASDPHWRYLVAELKPARRDVGSSQSAMARVAFLSVRANPVVAQAPAPRERKAPRTWLPFAGPDEMRIAFEGEDGDFEEPMSAFDAARRLNLWQGQTHRFRLTGLVPDQPELTLVADIEVRKSTPLTRRHLQRAAVVVRVRPEEAAQAVRAPVVKVFYLSDSAERPTGSIANAEEVVSTSLPPGVDALAEARRRGTVVAVVRLGAPETEFRARER